MSSALFLENSDLNINKYHISEDQKIQDSVISKQMLKDAQSSLDIFGDSNFLSDIWILHMRQRRKPQYVYFDKLEIGSFETTLLKFFSLDTLMKDSSITLCRRQIHDCTIFFRYLDQQHLSIANISTYVLDHFADFLDSNTQMATTQKNAIASSVRSLLTYLCDFNILRAGIITFESHWKDNTPNAVTRAPEKNVVTALDMLFFDLKTDIPLDCRCAYLIMRLIPNRISEVIGIQMDSLQYIDESVFSISIPTQKSSALNIPIFKEYYFKIGNEASDALHQIYLAQHKYAASVQNHLREEDKDYLLVSSSGNGLLTVHRFNDCLRQLIENNCILNSNGSIAIVTSHALRHVCIVERLNSGFISPAEAQIEANHTHADMTLGYGYGAASDEIAHFREISESTFVNTDQNHNRVQTEIPKRKYTRLLQQDTIRLIPQFGICCDMQCTPQHEHCFGCKYFKPKPAMMPYFKEAVLIIMERIKKLESNKRSSQKVLTWNKNQLKLFQTYLKLCEDIEECSEERL